MAYTCSGCTRLLPNPAATVSFSHWPASNRPTNNSRLPSFKDQARTVQPPPAAPASNRPTNNNVPLPGFMDQVHNVTPLLKGSGQPNPAAATNTEVAPRPSPNCPVKAMAKASTRLPTVKDQARSIMAPATTQATHQQPTVNPLSSSWVPVAESIKGEVPSFKDQVRSRHPQQQQPVLASAQGVPVPSLNGEPSTVIAQVLETIHNDDDNNPTIQPQQSAGNSNPTTNNGNRKHLIWAGGVVILGTVVAVVVTVLILNGQNGDESSLPLNPTTIAPAPIVVAAPSTMNTPTTPAPRIAPPPPPPPPSTNAPTPLASKVPILVLSQTTMAMAVPQPR